MGNPKTFKKPDKIILLFAVIMSIFGLIMIYDASLFRATHDFQDQFHFLQIQAIWIIFSTIPAVIIYFWDYRKFAKLATPAFIILIILLIAVLIGGAGINGAKRWFNIGPLPLQPAELIKPVFILYIASWLSKEQRTLTGHKSLKEALQTDFGKHIFQFLFLLALTLGLIVIEPDLGTTMVIGLTAVAIFFISGTDYIHRIGTIGVVAVLGVAGLLAGVLESYRFKRITTFIGTLTTGEVPNIRDEGLQMYQILISIGSGGFFGTGFGQSRQRFGYLVENTAFTDSIIAVVLEEFGLFGGLIFVAAWVIFAWRGLVIAIKAPDRLGQLLAAGITIWLVVQAFMNIAANISLMPLTGIPLPFLSYGGSNTLATFIGIAILLNISRLSGEKR